MSNNHSFAPANASQRYGLPSEYKSGLNPPMEAGAMDRLTAWLAGQVALTRSEAHSLLDSMVRSGQLTHHRAEFVAAIKALAAGPGSWHDMGYRLRPDD